MKPVNRIDSPGDERMNALVFFNFPSIVFTLRAVLSF